MYVVSDCQTVKHIAIMLKLHEFHLSENCCSSTANSRQNEAVQFKHNELQFVWVATVDYCFNEKLWTQV